MQKMTLPRVRLRCPRRPIPRRPRSIGRPLRRAGILPHFPTRPAAPPCRDACPRPPSLLRRRLVLRLLANTPGSPMSGSRSRWSQCGGAQGDPIRPGLLRLRILGWLLANAAPPRRDPAGVAPDARDLEGDVLGPQQREVAQADLELPIVHPLKLRVGRVGGVLEAQQTPLN